MQTVAVVLSVYNEESLIASVLGQVTDFARTHETWRFVFVDDGSGDDTPRLVREHLDQLETDRLELIALQRNQGKARAIRDAVLATTEDLVLFTDGDLAYPLEHLDGLVEALGGADVAIGSRALADTPQTNISLARRVVGSTFNLIVRLITRLPYRDTQAGLKGFRRDAADILFTALSVKDFAFDAELLYLAKILDLQVTEIPANVSTHHSYKKSHVNMLRDPPRMLASLVRMLFAHGGLRKRPPSEIGNERAKPLAKATIETRAEQDSSKSTRASSDA